MLPDHRGKLHACLRLAHEPELETERRSLFALGTRHWDIPRLRTLLEDAAPTEILFTGVEVEHGFPEIGRCVVLNGRRIVSDDGTTPLILLAIEDITTRRDFERREHFLAETAAAFAASIGYDATIDAIGSIAVPTFADWCIADVHEPDGTVRRVLEHIMIGSSSAPLATANLAATTPAGQRHEFGALLVAGTAAAYGGALDEISAIRLTDLAQPRARLRVLRRARRRGR